MDLTAIDIVLLPPLKVMRRIINLTERLPDAPTQLNMQNCLPHISLSMGLADEQSILAISKVLTELADRKPLQLSAARTRYYHTPDGKAFSELVVECTDQLIELHSALEQNIRPLFTSGKAEPAMFVSPPAVAPISTHWVEHYYDAPATFSPHITLGEGRARELIEPLQFTAGRLALCKLGTYCTCREILAEVRLAS